MECTTYLAAPGSVLSEIHAAPMVPARLDYRISPELLLLRAEATEGLCGGAMVLGDSLCTVSSDAAEAALARQVFRECRRRGFTAVAADFSAPAQLPLMRVLETLSALLQQESILLFVTPAYADAIPTSRVLLPCLFREGSFRAHLERYRAQWKDRAALDLNRMCHCFPHQGSPQALTRRELKQLRARLRPMSFYSRERYCNYFSYRSGQGPTLVLYDEENTLRQKLLLAQSLGFSSVFLLWQEVEDLLPQLLRELKGNDTIGPSHQPPLQRRIRL